MVKPNKKKAASEAEDLEMPSLKNKNKKTSSRSGEKSESDSAAVESKMHARGYEEYPWLPES